MMTTKNQSLRKKKKRLRKTFKKCRSHSRGKRYSLCESAYGFQPKERWDLLLKKGKGSSKRGARGQSSAALSKKKILKTGGGGFVRQGKDALFPRNIGVRRAFVKEKFPKEKRERENTPSGGVSRLRKRRNSNVEDVCSEKKGDFSEKRRAGERGGGGGKKRFGKIVDLVEANTKNTRKKKRTQLRKKKPQKLVFKKECSGDEGEFHYA